MIAHPEQNSALVTAVITMNMHSDGSCERGIAVLQLLTETHILRWVDVCGGSICGGGST